VCLPVFSSSPYSGPDSVSHLVEITILQPWSQIARLVVTYSSYPQWLALSTCTVAIFQGTERNSQHFPKCRKRTLILPCWQPAETLGPPSQFTVHTAARQFAALSPPSNAIQGIHTIPWKGRRSGCLKLSLGKSVAKNGALHIVILKSGAPNIPWLISSPDSISQVLLLLLTEVTGRLGL
jgi:hypothetical protein